MGWKDWSYWIRGGIIGVIVGMIAIPASIAIALASDCVSDCTPIWAKLFSLFSGWLIIIIDKSLYLLGMGRIAGFLETPLLILVPVTYFLYGSIIGWIIGKIKSKKNQS